MKAFYTILLFNCIQCLHDVCLVRAFEVAGDESYLQLASLCRYFVLVDDSVGGVFISDPANRIGFIGNGGPFSLMQLKVIQEVVTLIIFTIFTTVLFKGESLHWNHFAAFVCLVLAVYLSFINRMNVMSNGWNRQFYQGKLFVFAA